MADYKTEADWFERDRKHKENLLLLCEFYGGTVDTVLEHVRTKPKHLIMRIVTRNGKDKILPSVSDFQDVSRLTDPELAELFAEKLRKWDELRDGSAYTA